MQEEMKPQMPVDNHEAEMARADLYKMAKYSMKLFQMIQEGQELEGWVQSKITKASDYISSIYHYMEYQMKFGSGMPAESVDDITREAGVVPDAPMSEEDDEIAEGLTYEQRLHALLEGRVKKVKKGMTAKTKSKVDEAKPDFLDMDKDGDKKEPMKKAVADKKKNPFGNKKVKEGMKVGDKKDSSTGGTIEKTKTGVKHHAGKNYGGSKAAIDDKEEDEFGFKKTQGRPAKKVK